MTTDIVTVEKEEKALTRITNYMESSVVRARFAQIMGERGASTYISSVLIAVADSFALQKCSPASVYTSALRAATLRLSVDPGTGQAYLVPYGAQAKLIIGYKGLIDMAVRTNRYRYINASEIYEGQEVELDQITGFHKIGGRRTGDKVIGWIAAFEMLPKFARYAKTFYWDVEKIHEHGKKYSSSYGRKDSAWQTNPADMEKKTVLRQLLRKWGYLDPADVQVLDEIDSEVDLEADEIQALTETTTKRGPEIHNSPDASVAVLMGNPNPDPVKDSTWADWEAWKERADKAGVILSDVKRNGTTEGDLRDYLAQIAPEIVSAEQLLSGDASQETLL